MALNSSGPISLAGTTTGQSIEVELGGNGTTQISLNDTTVRDLAGATTPLSMIVMPLNFWGKSAGSYWIGYCPTLGVFTPVLASYGNGNVFVGGRIYPTSGSNEGSAVATLSETGSLSNTTKIWSTLNLFATEFLGAYPNGSGGIIISGRTKLSALAGNSVLASCYAYLNSSNVVQSTNTFYVSTVYSDTALSVARNSSGYLAVGGNQGAATSWATVSIFDSSGNLITKRTYANNTAFSSITRVLVDSSGSFLCFGGTARRRAFWKYTSTGGIVSETISNLEGTTAVNTYADAAYYNDSTIYAVYTHNATNLVPWPALVKMDNNHNIAWGMQWASVSPATLSMTNVKVDANGNAYAFMYETAAPRRLFIWKFNSSGTLLWQRSIQMTGFFDTNFALNARFFVDGNNGMYIVPFGSKTSTALSTFNSYILKLPIDGSKTGTYVINGITFDYAASSLSITSFTPVASAANTLTSYTVSTGTAVQNNAYSISLTTTNI